MAAGLSESEKLFGYIMAGTYRTSKRTVEIEG